jgi:hypothetical protein
MQKTKPLLILGAVGAALLVVSTFHPSDAEKLSSLERRCRETSEEVVLERVIAPTLSLHEVQFPPPQGTAKLPVLDQRYSPIYLVDELLKAPHAVPEVRFSYEVPAAKVTDSKCAGQFAISAWKPGDFQKQFPCAGRRALTDSFRGRYVVEIEYGNVDDLDIRAVELRIVDREKVAILGRQRGHQLLLGKMDTRESTRLLGWGSAQGAKSCELMAPVTFIKRVVAGGA